MWSGEQGYANDIGLEERLSLSENRCREGMIATSMKQHKCYRKFQCILWCLRLKIKRSASDVRGIQDIRAEYTISCRLCSISQLCCCGPLKQRARELIIITITLSSLLLAWRNEVKAQHDAAFNEHTISAKAQLPVPRPKQ